MIPSTCLRGLRVSGPTLSCRSFLYASSSSSLPSTSSFFSSTSSFSSSAPPKPPLAATAPVLAPDAANPPNTTRPPPLHLPVRSAETSSFAHLLATGKAYLAFYKTGLRYLYTNWTLVRAQPPASAVTRADLLLRRRWRHDVRRLPLFALMLVVCGEMTPFVVLVFPHLVPGPCRIPKQIDKLQRLTEQRRHAAFVDLYARHQQEQQRPPSLHIARSLELVSPFWDRIGWVPAGLARWTAARHLHFLAQDDALLRQSGGVPALVSDEVVRACADRGLDVRGLPDDRLRELLTSWLLLTLPQSPVDVSQPDPDGATKRRVALLTSRPDQWPLK